MTSPMWRLGTSCGGAQHALLYISQQLEYKFLHETMSSLINKIKEKTSSSKGSKGEQQFTTQPHPAVRPTAAFLETHLLTTP